MKPTVLVVDDKPNMLSLISKILSPDANVVTARGVQAALATIGTVRPNVVLCDLRMPDGDGLEVLQGLRASGVSGLFILMTAYGSVSMAVRAMREGVIDIVTKPFDPDRLRAVVLQAAAETPDTGTQPAISRDSSAAAVSGTLSGIGPRRLDEMTYREVVDGARDEVVRRYLEALLARFRGNVSGAAAHAGVERESFHRLLRRYDLRAERFRGDGESDAPSSTEDRSNSREKK